MRSPGASSRQMKDGKAARGGVPSEGEEMARAAGPGATPASQGALRRLRRSEEVEGPERGPDRSVTQQPLGAQRRQPEGGACPRRPHNKEEQGSEGSPWA